MKALDRLLHAWRWHGRPKLPALRQRDPGPYGYRLPRAGLSPLLIAFMVALAIAGGAWLGARAGAGGGGAEDPLGLIGAPAPSEPSGDERLREVIARLSDERVQARRDLAAASSRRAQAAAAQELRRGHLAAARALDRAQAAVQGALRRTADAYAAVVRAARAGDPRRFQRASAAVAAADRDFERLVGSGL